MSWGKEKYRYKFKETSDSIATIINNYRDLDQEYQELGKALLDIKEYIEEHTDKLKYTRIPKIDFSYKELYDLVNKALGDKENESR